MAHFKKKSFQYFNQFAVFEPNFARFFDAYLPK